MLDHLARLGQLDIAAAFGRQIDDHRTRRHRFNHGLGHEARRRTTRDQRGGDDDVLLGDVTGDQLGLRGLLVLGQLARIPTSTRSILERVGHDELGAQRFHLLAGCGAHVGRGHHGAQALGRRNGLQPRNTGTHHERLGRTHGARCGHHHGHGAVKHRRRLDNALIAGKVGLRGEDIHDLRARDARHEFHGNGGHAGLGQCGNIAFIAIGIECADHQRPLVDASQRGCCGTPHGQHNIGALERFVRTGGNRGTGCCIISIQNARSRTGVLFNRYAGAQRNQFADRFGGGRNAVLSLETFTDDGNFHEILLPACPTDRLEWNA